MKIIIRSAQYLYFRDKEIVYVYWETYRLVAQSTIHRITKFDLDKQYNEHVDHRIIEIMKEKIALYNKMQEHSAQGEEISQDMLSKMYLEILYSNPAGFMLTARITTNYRCLRNIYKQRKTHLLPEWREFCKWIETLPYAEEFLIN